MTNENPKLKKSLEKAKVLGVVAGIATLAGGEKIASAGPNPSDQPGKKIEQKTNAKTGSPTHYMAPAGANLTELKNRVQEKMAEVKKSVWQKDENQVWFRELPEGGKQVVYESGRTLTYNKSGDVVSAGFLKSEEMKALNLPGPEKQFETPPTPQKREIRTGGKTITTGSTVHIGGPDKGPRPADTREHGGHSGFFQTHRFTNTPQEPYSYSPNPHPQDPRMTESYQTGVAGHTVIEQSPWGWESPRYTGQVDMRYNGPIHFSSREMETQVTKTCDGDLDKIFHGDTNAWKVIKDKSAHEFLKEKNLAEPYLSLQKHLITLKKSTGEKPGHAWLSSKFTKERMPDEKIGHYLFRLRSEQLK